MKRIVFILSAFFFSFYAEAQLGVPTTSVKDTFDIVKTSYNGTELNRADWPATFIVEDANNIYVADYVYKKGQLQYKTEGNHYDATCNGTTHKVTVLRPSSYRSGSYVIGEYVFEVTARNSDISISRGNYSLAGRSTVSIPRPEYSSNSQGTVVVRIWVGRDGNVLRAEYQPKGSTTSDGSLVKSALDAARRAKFNADENSPEEQVGTLTYRFSNR